jgi:hypothetical protein
MPVYEISLKSATGLIKPRLIKAKTPAGALAHAAQDITVTRASAERLHLLAARGVKIEFAVGVAAEPQRDIEEPNE